MPLSISLPTRRLYRLVSHTSMAVLVLSRVHGSIVRTTGRGYPGLGCVLSVRGRTGRNGVLSLAGSVVRRAVSRSAKMRGARVAPSRLYAVVFASKAAKGDGNIVLAREGLIRGTAYLSVGLPREGILLSILPVRRTCYLDVSVLGKVSLNTVVYVGSSLVHITGGVGLFGPGVVLVMPLVVRAFTGGLRSMGSLPRGIMGRTMFKSRFRAVYDKKTCLGPRCVRLFRHFKVRVLRKCKVARYSPIVDAGIT